MTPTAFVLAALSLIVALNGGLALLAKRSTVTEIDHRTTGEAKTIGSLGRMRPLRYSINLSVDGCYDHRALPADEELHRRAAESLRRADALLFGRVTYEMMESAFDLAGSGAAEIDAADPFVTAINAAKKYVVSTTRKDVDWNTELVVGDLEQAIRALKSQPGDGLFVGGVTLPLTLVELGLIDEFEFLIHPRIVGHGPNLFEGLSRHVDLKLVDHSTLASGAIVATYVPR